MNVTAQIMLGLLQSVDQGWPSPRDPLGNERDTPGLGDYLGGLQEKWGCILKIVGIPKIRMLSPIICFQDLGGHPTNLMVPGHPCCGPWEAQLHVHGQLPDNHLACNAH